MGLDTLVLGFEWYIVFLFSTVCHEAAHALAALKLGDRTAYCGGQVSLDPAPHIRREPIGMVVAPIVSFFFFTNGTWMMGWASVPYDPYWAARYPKRAALMAFAGPLANLLIVLLSAIIIRVGMLSGLLARPLPGPIDMAAIVSAPDKGLMTGVATVVSILFSLNLALFVFNLLPLPPLDGSALPPLVLDYETTARYLNIIRSPGFSLFGLFIAWKVFPMFFGPVWLFALRVVVSQDIHPG